MKDASRVGEDGESHPRRILRSGENRASKLMRSRSDRVHVVDGESHPEAVIALQQRGIIRRHPRGDYLELTDDAAFSLHPDNKTDDTALAPTAPPPGH